MKKSIIRFGVIGGATTVIDWAIYWFLSKAVGITIAKICSMILASIFSYIFNKLWTFENSDRNHVSYLWKYYITFAINVTINTTINTFMFNKTNEKLISLIVATGCATIVNYLLQRFWVFGEKGEGHK